jgi:hypothetical protein
MKFISEIVKVIKGIGRLHNCVKAPVFAHGGIADMQRAFPGRIEKYKQQELYGCDKDDNFSDDKLHVSLLLVIG